jgi:hypothetical protein
MPLFPLSQLENKIEARAMPKLRQLSANPTHLENDLNHRFERNGPPPYVSSSESEEEELLFGRKFHPAQAASKPHEAILKEFGDLLNKPLDDRETIFAVHALQSSDIYSPSYRYRYEAEQEHDRLNAFVWSDKASLHVKESLSVQDSFPCTESRGYQRRDVIVRHNIK